MESSTLPSPFTISNRSTNADAAAVDPNGNSLDFDKNDNDGATESSRNNSTCSFSNEVGIIVLSVMNQSEMYCLR
jgi:hypothetical protein